MKYFIIVIFCVLTITVQAQTGGTAKTLFGGKDLKVGYFVNPSVQVGEIAGKSSTIPGIGAGVILDNKVSMSILYKMSLSENTPPGELNEFYLHSQFVGLKLEYLLKPDNPVHLTFPLELGAGDVELDLKDNFENSNISVPSEDRGFFYIEPGIALEVNVMKYLKFGIGASYRLVSNMTFRTVSSNDLQGFNISAGIKVGLF
jgi:hypothetical protein